MADLPQHVASIMVLDGVHFGDYRFAHMFDFNWFRPYWFGYSLIWLLSYLVGLVWAAKLVVAAAIVGFVLSLALLRREVNAPSLVDWFFLAVPFGFAYEWGFLSFIVCAPLGPLFLVHYHRFLEKAGRASQPWYAGSLGIMAWIVVLFFGHLLMLAFFCLAASAMALRDFTSLSLLVKRIAPMTISIPMGLAWITLSIEPRGVSNPLDWGLGFDRLTRFFPDLFSLEYNAGQTTVAVLLVLLPFLLGVRPRWSVKTIAPVSFYVLFMLLAPSLVMDNLGTYERFQLFGMMFYALMLADADVIEPTHLPKVKTLLVALPGIVGLALLVRIAIKSYGFEQESADFHRLISHTVPEQRALGLVDMRNGEFTRTPVYMHFPVWYQVEAKGLVDFNFAQWPSLNSFYKPEYRSRITSDFAWAPYDFNWQLHNGDAYRYFIVRGTPEFVTFLFRDDMDKVSLIYEGRTWFLLERNQ